MRVCSVSEMRPVLREAKISTNEIETPPERTFRHPVNMNTLTHRAGSWLYIYMYIYIYMSVYILALVCRLITDRVWVYMYRYIYTPTQIKMSIGIPSGRPSAFTAPSDDGLWPARLASSTPPPAGAAPPPARELAPPARELAPSPPVCAPLPELSAMALPLARQTTCRYSPPSWLAGTE